MPRCTHLTRTGTRCRRMATSGHVCTQHYQIQTGGLYTVRTAYHGRHDSGEDDPELELFSAGKHNQRQKVEQLLKAGTDVNWLLYGGTSGGQIDLVNLAKERGATNFVSMFLYAVKKNHPELAKLALTWGAHDIKKMISIAIAYNHFDVIEHLISNPEYKEDILQAAIKHQKTDVLTSAIQLKMITPNALMDYAAQVGLQWLAEFSKQMGFTDFNRMATMAKENKNTDLCRLAKKWGATEPNKCGWFS